MLFDTHAHIQFQSYKVDREEVLKRSLEKGVIMNMVGTQKDTSRMAVELAEKYNNIYASIGTHPIHLHSTHVDEEESSFLSREEEFDDAYYEALFQSSKKIIGVGETGLDLFHIPKDKSPEEVLTKQKEVFLGHIAFAQRHNLPLVIHCRDAHDQMIEVLKTLPQSGGVGGGLTKGGSSDLKAVSGSTNDGNTERPHLTSPDRGGIPVTGTIHCYTSHWEHAQEYLKLGFYLGFTGVITFPPKKNNSKPQEQLLEVVKKAPLDRIVVETDSPYLTPQVERGRRNEPWLVEEVVKKIAQVRGISFEEAMYATTENAKRLFRV